VRSCPAFALRSPYDLRPHGFTCSDRKDRRGWRRRGARHQRLNSPYRTGAELFATHCSGCHTLSLVGAEGSATSVQGRLRTNGPNFNFRKEGYSCVLYAIENGGFSGQIMPQNIVVGPDAVAVAHFLARYAGLQAPHTPTIGPSNSCSG
jgi:hypothetical protein